MILKDFFLITFFNNYKLFVLNPVKVIVVNYCDSTKIKRGGERGKIKPFIPIIIS